jgi:hypothetical protein
MCVLWEKVPYIAEFVEELPVGKSATTKDITFVRSIPMFHR